MAFTVRLDPETERVLNALAKRRQQSRSDVVREAIVQYGATDGNNRDGGGAFDAWQDVIGVTRIGARERSRTTGEQFTSIVRKKHARHAR